MKNLYRRYRPLKLGEVVGQPQVTEPLSSALKAGKIGHAYLFVGPRGCGKTSVARILAHVVNGFKYEVEDDYVDIIEIDGASNRGIDNIRELREKVMIAPSQGKYKVYIIDEVHMLTKEAFNALLKTLEEPPEHVIFIMATTDAFKVPVTITSRAQTYTFKLVDASVMSGYLKSVCEKEGIKIEDAALDIIVKRGGGSFRDSLSLLDQISTLSSEMISKDLVVKAMGLPEDEKIAELVSCYASGDVVKITTLLKDLLSSGVRVETLVEEMIASIIENPAPEILPLLAKLPEVKAPFAEAKLLVALCGDLTSATQRGGTRDSRLAQVTRSGETQDGIMTPAVKRGNVQSSSAMQDPKRADTPDVTTKLQSVAAQEPAAKPSPAGRDFDWSGFLEKVRSLNDAIYSQVVKASFNVSGDTLEIYPEKKVAKMILSRDNNKKILIEAAGGMRVTVGEPGENPNAIKDELISKISGIMGGEVRNDGGGNPF